MNRYEGSGSGEAKINYLDGDYEIVIPGSHVRCAVTSQAIALEELKYWSVERQEAYVDALVSFKRESECSAK